MKSQVARHLAIVARDAIEETADIAASARILADRPVALLIETGSEDEVQRHVNRLAGAWLEISDPALLAASERVAGEVNRR